jgi:FtsH-binding integral membrane protein
MKELFTKVYKWMAIGLLLSFVTAFYVGSNPTMVANIFGGYTFMILFLLQIGVVVYLTRGINKMSIEAAKVAFIIYSILEGLTLSVIFVVYEMNTIYMAFMAATVLFAVLSFIGMTTKKDLSKMGNILFAGLISIIIMSIVNLFLGNTMLDLILCVVGIVIFIGLIAYDTNKIKRYSNSGMDQDKVAIYGALQLYLDFINLFLRLLRIFDRN